MAVAVVARERSGIAFQTIHLRHRQAQRPQRCRSGHPATLALFARVRSRWTERQDAFALASSTNALDACGGNAEGNMDIVMIILVLIFLVLVFFLCTVQFLDAVLMNRHVKCGFTDHETFLRHWSDVKNRCEAQG